MWLAHLSSSGLGSPSHPLVSWQLTSPGKPLSRQDTKQGEAKHGALCHTHVSVWLQSGAVWSCLLRLLPQTKSTFLVSALPCCTTEARLSLDLPSTSRTVYFSRTRWRTCLISYLISSILSGQNEDINNGTYWIIILFHTQPKSTNSGLRTRELLWLTLPVKYIDL